MKRKAKPFFIGPIVAMWPEFQQELAAQLPNSTHIIAEKSGHFIQKDQPQLVIDAIREMVNGVRDTTLQ